MKILTNAVNDDEDEDDKDDDFDDERIDKVSLPTYVDSAISHLHNGYGEVQAQGVVHYLNNLYSLSKHLVIYFLDMLYAFSDIWC